MLLAFLLAVELSARWLAGLEGAVVDDVVVAAGSGRRVFAAALREGSAIYRSEDGGTTWERMFEAPSGMSFSTVATDPHDPDRVFAAVVFYNGSDSATFLQRSLDGGITWSLRHDWLNSSRAEIVFDRFVPGAMYVSYAGFGSTFRSLDGGETFEESHTPFTMAHLAAAPDGTIVAVNFDGRAFRSSDLGRTWALAGQAPLSPQCSVSALAVDPSDPRLWFIGSSSPLYQCGEAFRTEDAGATWSTAPIGGPVSDIEADPAHPGLVYASTAPKYPTIQPGRVLASADGGWTWQDLELPHIIGARALALTGDGSRLYAATQLGVFQRDLRRPKAVPSRSSPPRLQE